MDLSKTRIVDLTHAYSSRTLYWPTSPTKFVLDKLSYGRVEGGFFYSAYSICTPEHGGTHLDAPVHFAENGLSTDELPLENLVAPAVVIDVTEKAARDRDYRLQVADVEAFEAQHGRIAAGTIVLVRTGWSRHWPDVRAYLGDDTPGDASRLSFPGYGEDAAQLLVEGRGVAMLGIDTASIDYGRSQDFPVHRIAGAANVAGLENLTNLDVPATWPADRTAYEDRGRFRQSGSRRRARSLTRHAHAFHRARDQPRGGRAPRLGQGDPPSARAPPRGGGHRGPQRLPRRPGGVSPPRASDDRRHAGADRTGTDDEARKAVGRINAIHGGTSGTLGETAGVFSACTKYSATSSRPPRVGARDARGVDSARVPSGSSVRSRRPRRTGPCPKTAESATLFGIPDDRPPRSVRDLDRYMKAMIASGEVCVTDRARSLAQGLLYPPLMWPARRLFGVARLATIGILPADIRRA